MESHLHKTDDLARETLKRVATNFGIRYSDVLTKFRNGHQEVTYHFWTLIAENKSNKYNRIDYCPECRKFTLYNDPNDTLDMFNGH